jgi:F-box and WD-40 domain protein CDC4
LVEGDEDKHIDIYDIKTGALRKKLKGHEDGIWGLGYHGNT